MNTEQNRADKKIIDLAREYSSVHPIGKNIDSEQMIYTSSDSIPSSTTIEPLLMEDRSRFCLMPIQYSAAYMFYKKARESSWEAHEIDFSEDKVHFKSLTPQERKTVLGVVAFFQVADGIVAENIVVNFYNKIAVPEIRLFYGVQIAQEGVHAETYGMTIEALVDSIEERMELLNSISTIPAIKKKADWGIKWMQNGTFGEQVPAFGMVEGIFFSSSFCIIFWLKKRGLMPGLTFSNEFISREEKMHCDFSADILWPHIVGKPSKEHIYNMARECVECEKEFVRYILPEPLIGMNAESMSEYVEFIADRILASYGLDPIYRTRCPFSWMNLMGIPGRTSFFEKAVADYPKKGEAPIIRSVNYNESEF